MLRRAAVLTVALAMVVGLATGCQPEPAPSPSGPVFATEDEAFAAAEETYRAYVDALNQVDLSDPETFEAVYAWTTGDANANERKTLTQMHADGWTVSGETALRSFRGETADLDSIKVSARVCSDISAVDVVDANGESVVAAQRPDAYALVIEFISSTATATGLVIATSNAVEDSSCP